MLYVSECLELDHSAYAFCSSSSEATRGTGVPFGVGVGDIPGAAIAVPAKRNKVHNMIKKIINADFSEIILHNFPGEAIVDCLPGDLKGWIDPGAKG